LNRPSAGEADPSKPPRSRGLLCRDLLKLKTAAAAAEFVKNEKAEYQPFTVVFADSETAWIAYNLIHEIKTVKLGKGLHVYSSGDESAARSQKVDHAYSRFSQVVEESQSNGHDQLAWITALGSVLGDHTSANGSGKPKGAICVHGDISGTVSSTIVFYSQSDRCFYAFNCPGPPCQTPFGQALALHVR
jgi:uncharacterized protein with NRDE domain